MPNEPRGPPHPLVLDSTVSKQESLGISANSPRLFPFSACVVALENRSSVDTNPRGFCDNAFR